MIRLAVVDDLDIIKKIANQNRDFIGFVMKVALIEAISKKSLLVFDSVDGVLGFIHYHPRQDGWHTVHELAVMREHQGKGIGKALFDTVPLPIRLKTTVDNSKAIEFYTKNDMLHVRNEKGKKRELVVFEKS
jgi:GNAT superfamily N-acetyltransferase